MKFTQEQKEKGQNFYQSLVAKAWKNAKFKKELVENPREVIESLTGSKMNLPENTMVLVEDQSDSSTIYLNIPRKIDFEDMVLSDSDLEAVSGGFTIVIACCALIMLGKAIGDEF